MIQSIFLNHKILWSLYAALYFLVVAKLAIRLTRRKVSSHAPSSHSLWLARTLEAEREEPKREDPIA